MSLQIEISKLTDDSLFKRLREVKIDCGPVTPTTRSIYEKKLLKYYNSKGITTSQAPVIVTNDNSLEVPASTVSTNTSFVDISFAPTNEHQNNNNNKDLNTSTCVDILNLTDNELLGLLKEKGLTAGPITNTTRSIYQNKLLRLAVTY
jgi:hypothetical protein